MANSFERSEGGRVRGERKSDNPFSGFSSSFWNIIFTVLFAFVGYFINLNDRNINTIGQRIDNIEKENFVRYGQLASLEQNVNEIMRRTARIEDKLDRIPYKIR